MTPAIETRDLTKRFSRTTVVDNLALNVPAGCIYGFLGPNGAGKTTSIRMVLGLLRQDHGTVTIMGDDLRSQRAAALSHVGAMVESTSLYDHLTGGENLRITQSLLRLPPSEIDRVLEIVDMRHATGHRVATYSMGMKQRLALGRALMGSPRILVLDEPTNGLDPDGIMAMRLLIRDLPSRIDGTVFLSSHLLAEVEQVADVVGIIDRGCMVVQDRVSELVRGTPSLLIGVRSTTDAAEMLASTNIAVGDVTGDEIELPVPLERGTREFAAMVNRKLVESGFAVHELHVRKRTLEDVFRAAVRPTTVPSPAAGRVG